MSGAIECKKKLHRNVPLHTFSAAINLKHKYDIYLYLYSSPCVVFFYICTYFRKFLAILSEKDVIATFAEAIISVVNAYQNPKFINSANTSKKKNVNYTFQNFVAEQPVINKILCFNWKLKINIHLS